MGAQRLISRRHGHAPPAHDLTISLNDPLRRSLGIPGPVLHPLHIFFDAHVIEKRIGHDATVAGLPTLNTGLCNPLRIPFYSISYGEFLHQAPPELLRHALLNTLISQLISALIFGDADVPGNPMQSNLSTL